MTDWKRADNGDLLHVGGAVVIRDEDYMASGGWAPGTILARHANGMDIRLGPEGPAVEFDNEEDAKAAALGTAPALTTLPPQSHVEYAPDGARHFLMREPRPVDDDFLSDSQWRSRNAKRAIDNAGRRIEVRDRDTARKLHNPRKATPPRPPPPPNATHPIIQGPAPNVKDPGRPTLPGSCASVSQYLQPRILPTINSEALFAACPRMPPGAPGSAAENEGGEPSRSLQRSFPTLSQARGVHTSPR